MGTAFPRVPIPEGERARAAWHRNALNGAGVPVREFPVFSERPDDDFAIMCVRPVFREAIQPDLFSTIRYGLTDAPVIRSTSSKSSPDSIQPIE